MSLPALFVSHGAPSLVLDDTPAHAFLAGFGEKLIAERGRPSAILMMSAHFEADAPSLTIDAHPDTMHDFGGFAPELHAMTYPAPGSPALARRAADLIAAAGGAPRLVKGRGFDHGTWAPLMLLFPDADIPVVQLSVSPRRDGRWHAALGAAVAPLRDENVLIVGSGAATHNLREIFMRMRAGGVDAEAPAWATLYNEWIADRIAAGALDDVADADRRAPHMRDNHPTPDHFLPLPFAMGAAGAGVKGERIHASSEYGAMMMDAYSFG